MDLAQSNPISPHALPHLSGSNDFDGADSEWSGGTAPANRLAYGLCATRRMCDMCNLEPYLRPQRLVEQL